METLPQREYEYSPSGDSIWSLDSMTSYWMEKTFTDEFEPEISDTAYICGNPYFDSILDPAKFDMLDEVWKYA
jgi:hypothetical protein